MLTATDTQWRHARFSTLGAKVGLGGGRDNGVKPIQSAMLANSFPQSITARAAAKWVII